MWQRRRRRTTAVTLALAMLALAVLAILGVAGPAAADSAPLVPEARGLVPLDGTAVRMVEEQVDIDVVASGEDRAPYKALVMASFWFETDREQSLKVGFPYSWFPDNSSGPQGLLRDFQVSVDGRAVEWSLAPVQGGTWAVWQQTFAPGRLSLHQVRYTMLIEMTRWPRMELHYLLKTGAHWRGPIGAARVRVRFPWPVDAASVVSSLPVEVAGATVTWTARDFEPDTDFSLRVTCGDRVNALAADYALATAAVADPEALTRCLQDIDVCEAYLSPDAGTALLVKFAGTGQGPEAPGYAPFVSAVRGRLRAGRPVSGAVACYYLNLLQANMARGGDGEAAVRALAACLDVVGAGMDRDAVAEAVDWTAAKAFALLARERGLALEVEVPAALAERHWRPWASLTRVVYTPAHINEGLVPPFLARVAGRVADVEYAAAYFGDGPLPDLSGLVARAAPRFNDDVPVLVTWSYRGLGRPVRTNGTVSRPEGVVRLAAQGLAGWEFVAECRRDHPSFWLALVAGLAWLGWWAYRRRTRGRRAPPARGETTEG